MLNFPVGGYHRNRTHSQKPSLAGNVPTFHPTGRGMKADQMGTAVKNLRGKLGDDADNPAYIFNEPRVGYRMPKGEGQEKKDGLGL